MRTNDKAPHAATAKETAAKADTKANDVPVDTSNIMPEGPARREDRETKTFKTMDTETPLERVQRESKGAVAEPRQFMFLSQFPALQIYIDMGLTETEAGTSNVVSRPVAVRFTSGVFITKNSAIAAAMRKHKRFGSMFREELNAEATMMRAKLADARAKLRSPTYAGPTASSDGQESAFNAQDYQLAQVEQKFFNY